MAILKVGVVGCGLMGRGIAQVSAQAGFPTVVREVAREPLDRGLAAIHATARSRTCAARSSGTTSPTATS
jgi:3-hydroxybutyryl-CoA dehydrogenase